MSDMSSITGEQIRAAREMVRMTQRQLAEEVGVSLRTVSSWERGESIPRNRAGAIMEVLSIPDIEEPEFGYKALLRRLGELGKQRREELGIGRVALSKEMGLGSDKTLVTFEYGRTGLTGTSYRRIEKGLGWKLGIIDDVLRDKNRKASSITMEELDAEDRMHLDQVSGVRPLALVSNEDLLDELRRRLAGSPAPFQNDDVQNLYGLAASTNHEHLEDEYEDGEGKGTGE